MSRLDGPKGRRGLKLIRDRVPVNDGGTEGPRATGPTLQRLLAAKIGEEALEVMEALDAGDEEQAVEELADAQEALDALAMLLPGGPAAVTRAQILKAGRRGGFTRGRTYRYPEQANAPGGMP